MIIRHKGNTKANLNSLEKDRNLKFMKIFRF